MSFWRKFIKVFFVISLVLWLLGVLGATVACFAVESWLGLVVLPVGTVLVLSAHAFMGIFLEMVDNIAAIRQNTSCGYQVNAGQFRAAPAANAAYNNSNPAMDQPYYAPVAPAGWFCEKCGVQNGDDCAFCQECGSRKA